MPTQLAITRRTFLQGLGATGLLATLPGFVGCRQGGGKAGRRPNFVFIMVDDLRHDALGFTGAFPFLRTPNLDRLAAEGAAFSNAFVTTSLCSPSRASIMTSTYPHVHGVRGNETQDMDPGLPSVASALRAGGYRTAFVGKWHQAHSAEPRPGFDTWLSFAGQGEYVNPPLNENGREFLAEGYMTDLLNDYAVNWIAQHPSEQPFCLFLWHKAVHGPFLPAERHADAFPDARLSPNPGHDDDLAGKPRWQRWLTTGNKLREIMPRDAAVPERVPPKPFDPQRKKRLDMLRALLSVDDGVGRILAALEKAGTLEDTVVMFGSDNGYFFGEHHLGDKRVPYEESIRVPLLLRCPRLVKAGTRIDPMVLYLDLAPTMLELAGVDVPRAMQGRSFQPLLSGAPPAEWRRSFLYEYYRDPEIPGFPAMLAARNQRWKYIVCPEDPDELDELYDLEKDPHELNNLAADAAHADTLVAMRDELRRLMQETGCPELSQWRT